ncbi:MAG: hypothetical protein KBG30_12245 [Bacteroidales bacterium]|nr:hypothetical protein [Bacteroidales bacterium]
MLILKDILVSSYRRLVDGTIRISIDTQELSGDSVAALHEVSMIKGESLMVVVVTIDEFENALAHIKPSN